MAGWQPTWQLLVAFNNTVFEDPASITTVASPAGTLGAHNVWTDITPWVVDNIDTNRGRQHETDRFQPGTLTAGLWNSDGRFDSWNTSSPYNGLVTPGRPCRLQATDPNTAAVTALYTGVTDIWATQWAAPSRSTVQLSCVDWFAYLNLAYSNPAYYVSVVLADTPTGFWRLNDAFGSQTAADTSGSGNNGTVVGTPVFGIVAGPTVADPATSVTLGSHQKGPLAHIRSSGVANPTADFTVEVWVQYDGIPAVRSQIWCQVSSQLNIWIEAATGKAGISWGGSDSVGTTNICDNNWHHLVFVGVFGSTAALLYVDTVLQVNAISGTPFTDSVSLIGSGGQFVSSCQGNVADVAIYASALTAAKVAVHYAAAGLFAPAEGSGARVSRVAAGAGVPTANATIDTGKSTLPAQTGTLATTAALSYLQTVEQTELGALFISGAGQIRFMSRDTVYTALTSSATFGDGGGAEIPFELNPTIAVDTLDQYTTVVCQRDTGQPQTATTGVLGKTLSISGLLTATDTEVFGMANWLLGQFSGTPKPRIRGITVHPLVTPATGAATTAVLGLELMSVVTVNRHTVPGAGTAFAQIANVEGINHHIYPATGDWTVELQLTPIPPKRPWILGVSQLGVDTNLFF